MKLKKCTMNDVKQLAILNKRLIEDEKSDNRMTLEELEKRMQEFLSIEYCAYFFLLEDTIVGYALVKDTQTPYYLRQFLIDRAYRKQHLGLLAFHMLLEELQTDSIDIEVLSWNEAGKRFWEKCGFMERSRYMRFNKKSERVF